MSGMPPRPSDAELVNAIKTARGKEACAGNRERKEIEMFEKALSDPGPLSRFGTTKASQIPMPGPNRTRSSEEPTHALRQVKDLASLGVGNF